MTTCAAYDSVMGASGAIYNINYERSAQFVIVSKINPDMTLAWAKSFTMRRSDYDRIILSRDESSLFFVDRYTYSETHILIFDTSNGSVTLRLKA